MRKSMFAALLVLIMLLSGCSDVSTAPTRNDESEFVTETEAAAEAESTKSIYSSESNESKAPETSAALETAAEVTEREPVQSETVKQTEPVKQSEAETPATKPTTENNNPPPAETPTQAASENTKTAYDFEFDMEAIKADCIGVGQSMGLRLDTSLTPSNASWWNPVTASRSNQGEVLKQSLESTKCGYPRKQAGVLLLLGKIGNLHRRTESNLLFIYHLENFGYKLGQADKTAYLLTTFANFVGKFFVRP